LNKLIKDGASYAKATEALKEKIEFSKGTFYTHKRHVTHPLTTAVEEARSHPIIGTPRSNTAVVEAIRDIGMQNIMQNPEKITPSQTIRAAAILAEKENRKEELVIILAKEVMGPPRDLPLLEGEYRVLEE
jgi:hypothetical protein